jgi:hypothetical protein
MTKLYVPIENLEVESEINLPVGFKKNKEDQTEY